MFHLCREAPPRVFEFCETMIKSYFLKPNLDWLLNLFQTTFWFHKSIESKMSIQFSFAYKIILNFLPHRSSVGDARISWRKEKGEEDQRVDSLRRILKRCWWPWESWRGLLTIVQGGDKFRGEPRRVTHICSRKTPKTGIASPVCVFSFSRCIMFDKN